MSSKPGQPLAGQRVLVTRASGQAAELIARLEAAGAAVLHVPAIRFVPPPDWTSLDRVFDAPDEWDWIAFTSVNGVESFTARAKEKGFDPGTVIRARVAAVGKATADALRAIGVEPNVVPSRFLGAEVAPLLPDHARVAVVRALEGREELIDALREKGCQVHLAIAYETRGLDELPPDARSALTDGSIDALTFTSPSTVEHFLRHLMPDELRTLRASSRFVSIGPTTTAALEASGISGIVEAGHSDTDGLVSAVIDALSRR